MRLWFLLSFMSLALLAFGCDDGDDDDTSGDDDTADDDDDSGDDDDDTSGTGTYTPPPEDGLGPWMDWSEEETIEDVRSLTDEALKYALPGFTKGLIETMETLTADMGDDTCPAVAQSGPPDAVLTEYIGDGCTTADGTTFLGRYSILEEDAGSFSIYTWTATLYYIRPPESKQDVDSDEYFFHGKIRWSFNGDDLIGTMKQGLGEMEIISEDEEPMYEGGFEAHYVGPSPTDPVWNHVYLRGFAYAELNASQEIEYMHDMYITSNGFYSFTCNAMFTSDPDVCNDEPISGWLAVNGSPVSMNYWADGETACDGVLSVTYDVYDGGTYSEDIF